MGICLPGREHGSVWRYREPARDGLVPGKQRRKRPSRRTKSAECVGSPRHARECVGMVFGLGGGLSLGGHEESQGKPVRRKTHPSRRKLCGCRTSLSLRKPDGRCPQQQKRHIRISGRGRSGLSRGLRRRLPAGHGITMSRRSVWGAERIARGRPPSPRGEANELKELKHEMSKMRTRSCGWNGHVQCLRNTTEVGAFRDGEKRCAMDRREDLHRWHEQGAVEMVGFGSGSGCWNLLVEQVSGSGTCRCQGLDRIMVAECRTGALGRVRHPGQWISPMVASLQDGTGKEIKQFKIFCE